MTFNLIWRSESRAIVLSDTAVSREGAKPAHVRFPMSAFGDAAIVDALRAHGRWTGAVEEAAMKITAAAAGIAAASGDGATATAVMDALQLRKPVPGERVTDALAAATADVVSAGHCADGVTWLCADFRDGAPTTCAWRDGVQPGSSNMDVTISGSLTDDLADGINAVVGNICSLIEAQRTRGATLPPTIELSVLLAVVQAIASEQMLISSHSIGGAICGVMVDASGVTWQEDVIYFLSNMELADRLDEPELDLAAMGVEMVALSARLGCVCIQASLPGTTKVLVPGEQKFAYPAWRAQWEPRLHDPGHWLHARVVAFLNPQQRAVTVAVGDFTTPNETFWLSIDRASGAFTAHIGARLRASLKDVSQVGEPWHVHLETVPPYAAVVDPVP